MFSRAVVLALTCALLLPSSGVRAQPQVSFLGGPDTWLSWETNSTTTGFSITEADLPSVKVFSASIGGINIGGGVLTFSVDKIFPFGDTGSFVCVYDNGGTESLIRMVQLQLFVGEDGNVVGQSVTARESSKTVTSVDDLQASWDAGRLVTLAKAIDAGELGLLGVSVIYVKSAETTTGEEGSVDTPVTTASKGPIRVLSAFYGRQQPGTITKDDGTSQDGICPSSAYFTPDNVPAGGCAYDVTNWAKFSFDGVQTGQLDGNIGLLWLFNFNDPCGGIWKYLSVQYTCGDGEVRTWTRCETEGHKSFTCDESAPAPAGTYKGCWKGGPNSSNEPFDDDFKFATEDMTTSDPVTECVGICKDKGNKFAGLRWFRQCWCSDTFGSYGRSDSCNIPCAANPSTTCGGALEYNVFSTSQWDSSSCPVNCKKCIQAGACTECKDGFDLFNGDCVKKIVTEPFPALSTAAGEGPIRVVYSSYGRTENICQLGDHRDDVPAGGCDMDVTPIAQGLFNGQQNARFISTKNTDNLQNLFQRDPCPGVHKYLTVNYTCGDNRIRMFQTCEYDATTVFGCDEYVTGNKDYCNSLFPAGAATLETKSDAGVAFLRSSLPSTQTDVVFSVQAAQEAHIALFDSDRQESYRVVVMDRAGWTLIYRPTNGDPVAANTQPDDFKLSATEFRSFWISWALDESGNRNIVLGSGETVGQNSMLQFSDPSPKDVNSLGVQTQFGNDGSWAAPKCAAPKSAMTAPKPLHLGCWSDAATSRQLPVHLTDTTSSNPIEECANACKASGYRLSGLQWYSQCWCGNQFGGLGRASRCNSNCNSNRNIMCGGYYANNVYSVDGSVVCPSSCESCLSGSVCTACKAGYDLKSGDCIKYSFWTLTGNWGDAYILELPNGDAIGQFVSGNRPAFSGFRSGESVTLSFPDAGLQFGNLNSEGGPDTPVTIDWADGSQWSLSMTFAPSLVGKWKTTSGDEVEITQDLSPEEVNVGGTYHFLQSNTSVEFEAERDGDEVLFDFPWDRLFYAVLSPDGNTLQFDQVFNTWTRIRAGVTTTSMTILSAFYGRRQPGTEVCPMPGIDSDLTCSQDATEWAQKQFGGQASVFVPSWWSLNDVLGFDPCFGQYKYFSIQYSCGDDDVRTFNRCEQDGQDRVFGCTGNSEFTSEAFVTEAPFEFDEQDFVTDADGKVYATDDEAAEGSANSGSDTAIDVTTVADSDPFASVVLPPTGAADVQAPSTQVLVIAKSALPVYRSEAVATKALTDSLVFRQVSSLTFGSGKSMSLASFVQPEQMSDLSLTFTLCVGALGIEGKATDVPATLLDAGSSQKVGAAARRVKLSVGAGGASLLTVESIVDKTSTLNAYISGFSAFQDSSMFKALASKCYQYVVTIGNVAGNESVCLMMQDAGKWTGSKLVPYQKAKAPTKACVAAPGDASWLYAHKNEGENDSGISWLKIGGDADVKTGKRRLGMRGLQAPVKGSVKINGQLSDARVFNQAVDPNLADKGVFKYSATGASSTPKPQPESSGDDSTTEADGDKSNSAVATVGDKTFTLSWSSAQRTHCVGLSVFAVVFSLVVSVFVQG